MFQIYIESSVHISVNDMTTLLALEHFSSPKLVIYPPATRACFRGVFFTAFVDRDSPSGTCLFQSLSESIMTQPEHRTNSLGSQLSPSSGTHIFASKNRNDDVRVSLCQEIGALIVEVSFDVLNPGFQTVHGFPFPVFPSASGLVNVSLELVHPSEHLIQTTGNLIAELEALTIWRPRRQECAHPGVQSTTSFSLVFADDLFDLNIHGHVQNPSSQRVLRQSAVTGRLAYLSRDGNRIFRQHFRVYNDPVVRHFDMVFRYGAAVLFLS